MSSARFVFPLETGIHTAFSPLSSKSFKPDVFSYPSGLPSPYPYRSVLLLGSELIEVAVPVLLLLPSIILDVAVPILLQMSERFEDGRLSALQTVAYKGPWYDSQRDY